MSPDERVEGLIGDAVQLCREANRMVYTYSSPSDPLWDRMVGTCSSMEFMWFRLSNIRHGGGP